VVFLGHDVPARSLLFGFKKYEACASGHEEEPISEEYAMGHSLHSCRPSVAANVPAGHSWHTTWLLALDDPGGHKMHTSVGIGENEPASHGVHVVAELFLFVWNPGMQTKHLSCCACGA
jgi:hypothetical protein